MTNNRSDYYTIAVDVMGGDFGPRVTIPATLSALERYPRLSVKLVGQSDAISPYLNSLDNDLLSRIDVIHADTTISMSE